MSVEQGTLAPEFMQRRHNYYVAGMQHAAGVGLENLVSVDFGSPALADADAILNDQSIATAGSTTTLLDDEADAPYGRTITAVASGTATSTITIAGRDYLGQPVKKTKALTSGTPIEILTAFKWVDEISWEATSAITIDVGWGGKLGLPYRTTKVLQEMFDNAPQSIGTVTAAVYTDPATAATGDPRGLYTPTGTLNGAKRLVGTFLVDPSVTVNSTTGILEGGLHGIKQYFA